jgi:hypothetical protein
VDVEYSTHDDLKLGRTCIGINTCRVLAETDTEATLTALQMTLCHGVYVTRATIMEVFDV